MKPADRLVAMARALPVAVASMPRRRAQATAEASVPIVAVEWKPL